MVLLDQILQMKIKVGKFRIPFLRGSGIHGSSLADTRPHQSISFSRTLAPLVVCREAPSIQISPFTRREGGLFRVTILDNNVNTYEQVIEICMKALGITYDEGLEIALAVDNNGRADVFEGVQAEAEAVAGVIRTIGIEVLVSPA
jgi:ATP-dependent Clp protease adapter protein ClpS